MSIGIIYGASLGIRAEIDFNKGVFGVLAAQQKSEAALYFSLAEKNQALLKAVQAYFDLQTEQLKTTFLQALVNQADTLAQQLNLQCATNPKPCWRKVMSAI